MKVMVEDNFTRYRVSADEAIKRALTLAAAAAAAAARQGASSYQLTEILGSVIPLPPEQDKRGWHVSILARDWRVVLFEYGTYTLRKRPLKQPRRSDRANRGVVAGYFLTKAAKAAQAGFPALLADQFRRIRV